MPVGWTTADDPLHRLAFAGEATTIEGEEVDDLEVGVPNDNVFDGGVDAWCATWFFDVFDNSRNVQKSTSVYLLSGISGSARSDLPHTPGTPGLLKAWIGRGSSTFGRWLLQPCCG